MKERPILFKDAMVRAILSGAKTQTRRIVAFPRKRDCFICVDHGLGWWPYQSDDGESELCDDGMEHPYKCPFGEVGDRLYVREAFAVVPRTAYARSEDVQQTLRPDDDHDAAIYRSGWTRSKSGFRWKPSIHMPRWASRITLEITGVRVQRLNDISEADAIAEGVLCNSTIDYRKTSIEGGAVLHSHFVDGYKELWGSINGPGSWEANPWVWAIEFKRIEQA